MRSGTKRSFKGIWLLAAVLMGLFVLGAGNFALAEEAETTEVVKTLWWRAKTTAAVKAADMATGEKVKIKKGAKLDVTKRNYNMYAANPKSTCVYQGHTVRIPNKYLKFTKDLATGALGDYSTATKENFVNVTKRNLCGDKRGKGRLIWVCLEKQRVNVFTGTTGQWKLEQVFLTSTGTGDTPTRAKADFVNFKKDIYQIEGSRVQYFVEAIGSGFHKWPLKGAFRKKLGKHTISHGCIRLKVSDAKWMFNNIEVGTRVLIF